MERCQISFVVISLLLNIQSAETRCCTNTTLKLFEDQMQALQNSMRRILHDDCCCTANGPVGFHAHMGSRRSFAKGAVWVYDKVVTNTHNAYSATTGKFVAPGKGLYIFSYSTQTDPGRMAHARLFVNGKVKSWQGCNNEPGNRQWFTCSNTAILLLEKGDVVYVKDTWSPTPYVTPFYTDFAGARLS